MHLPNYMVTILPTVEDELAIRKLRSDFAATFHTEATKTPVQMRLIAPFIAKEEDISNMITHLTACYSTVSQVDIELLGLASVQKGRVVYVVAEDSIGLNRLYKNTLSCFHRSFPHIKLPMQHKFHPQVTIAAKVPPEIFANTTNFIAQPFYAEWHVRSVVLIQKIPKQDWTIVHTFPLAEI